MKKVCDTFPWELPVAVVHGFCGYFCFTGLFDLFEVKRDENNHQGAFGFASPF
jgi:hypothetical protein